MSSIGDALVGYFVGEAGKAVKGRLLRVLGEPEQRVFDQLVRASIRPAVERAAPQIVDQEPLVRAVERLLPNSFDTDIDDLLDPVEAVQKWLEPLNLDGGHGSNYFQLVGVERDVLCEAIAEEILQRLMHHVRTHDSLRAIANEIRWNHAMLYLAHLQASVDALLEQQVLARRVPGRPYMVPPKIGPVVSRPELQELILAQLLSGRNDGVAMSTTIKGAGGFGKTTLAEEICRNPAIARTFTGGILWASIGPGQGAAYVARTLNDLSFELSGSRPTFADPDRAGRHLEELLDLRPTLIVADDVWTPLHSRAFYVGTGSTGKHSALMISA